MIKIKKALKKNKKQQPTFPHHQLTIVDEYEQTHEKMKEEKTMQQPLWCIFSPFLEK